MLPPCVGLTPDLIRCDATDIFRSGFACFMHKRVILPGNRAPRGLAVIRAILAQAGRPLPRRDTGEAADGPRTTFDVTLGQPLFGPIVRYRGWVAPAC
jgi:hypothetical protein